MLKKRIASWIASLVAVTTATLVMAVPAQAAGVNYVALGDSYSSGVGAGTEISSSGDCRRTTHAYPELWAAANNPASYVSVACSGATTTTVLNTQLSALSSQTTLVSISVGGNDMGFADIMTTCVIFGTTSCVNAVNDAMERARNELPGLLNPVYSGIRQRAPNARVVVLGYPVFYKLGTFCIGLSETSRAKINEGINLIDDITKSVAQQHGFVFADVRQIFTGHEICSGDKWLHALNWANISVSYHPNTNGQALGYLPVFSQAAA
ncbi:MAG TPA: SGNH/GDSL hydrolase family protein [Micromonosporaceae bacterium]